MHPKPRRYQKLLFHSHLTLIATVFMCMMYCGGVIFMTTPKMQNKNLRWFSNLLVSTFENGVLTFHQFLLPGQNLLEVQEGNLLKQ